MMKKKKLYLIDKYDDAMFKTTKKLNIYKQPCINKNLKYIIKLVERREEEYLYKKKKMLHDNYDMPF